MGDTENILQTIKTTIQDIVAPDVRELKAQVGALGNRMDTLQGRMAYLEDQIKLQFDTFQRQSDAQFRAIMAAIQQSKAESELLIYEQTSALSERVAALEARRQ